ncbi:MAG: tRNA pseudouridine(38-40) synthase TruA [Acidobacteriota bacterium]
MGRSEQRRTHRLKYRMKLQYLGTRYHGWQVQKDRVTIQGVLRSILSELAGEPVSVVGASRTDAGVHALGQVAHFKFPPRETIPDLKKTLNALLPWDIRVTHLEPAPPKFHARWHACRKRYDYWIYPHEVLPPFLYGRILHFPQRLDVPAMQRAARHLEGAHDFSSFTAKASADKNHERTLFASRVVQRGRCLLYQVEGSGFLHHMVRNIVGTLLEVGQGERDPDSLPELLGARDRTLAGPTAPAQGLYLVRIWYPARWR